MSRLNNLLRATITRLTALFVLLGGIAAADAGDKRKQPLPAEDSRPEAALAGEVKELRQEVEAMRRDLRDVRSVLKRIEDRIGKEQGPSEFSPVTIRIQSEEGRPLEGFVVDIESARREVQRVSASGRSDRDGLALSRHLPYGDYRLTISEESGWSTSLRIVTVEVGTALEKVVVAPDPQERARLEVRSALRSEAFEGLRFGTRWQRTSSRGYGSPVSPEPGEEEDRFASFPTVSEVSARSESSYGLRLSGPSSSRLAKCRRGAGPAQRITRCGSWRSRRASRRSALPRRIQVDPRTGSGTSWPQMGFRMMTTASDSGNWLSGRKRTNKISRWRLLRETLRSRSGSSSEDQNRTRCAHWVLTRIPGSG